MEVLTLLASNPLKSLDESFILESLRDYDRSEIYESFSKLKSSKSFQSLLLQYLPYNSEFKFINNVFSSRNFESTLRGDVSSIPETVELHIGRKCQLKCSFCIQHAAPVSINNFWAGIEQDELLDLLHLEKLIDEFRDLGIKNIILSGSGDQEVFTNKDAGKIIEYIRKSGIGFHIYTNGINLAPFMQEILLANKIRFSTISPDGIKYSQIAQVPESIFDVVHDNIKNLVALRDRNGSNLSIGAHMVVNSKNSNEVKMMIKMSQELNVDFVELRTVFAKTEGDITDQSLIILRRELKEAYTNYLNGSYGNLKLSLGYELASLLVSSKIDRLEDMARGKYSRDGLPGIKLTISPTGHVYIDPDSYFGVLDISYQDSNPYVIGRVGRDMTFKEVIRRRPKKFLFEDTSGFDPWMYLTHIVYFYLRKNSTEFNLVHPLNFSEKS
jgi:MoaA/NifB/PqqE/SkfB family radical SAM enzyme